MKIAVTSQNFRTVTPHAAKTRRFLLFGLTSDGRLDETGRLDLPRNQAFHELRTNGPHPLDDVDILVVGSCGDAFVDRLARRGIRVERTMEADPRAAIRAILRSDTSTRERSRRPQPKSAELTGHRSGEKEVRVRGRDGT